VLASASSATATKHALMLLLQLNAADVSVAVLCERYRQCYPAEKNKLAWLNFVNHQPELLAPLPTLLQTGARQKEKEKTLACNAELLKDIIMLSRDKKS
jgi:hypothetical protein